MLENDRKLLYSALFVVAIFAVELPVMFFVGPPISFICTDNRADAAQSEQKPQTTPRIVTVSKIAQRAAEPECRPEKKGYREYLTESWNWLTDDANHLIALGTLILAAFAFAQWRDSRKSSERQLRAYVLVDSANTYDASRIGANSVDPTVRIWLQWTGYAAADLLVKNSGQTPAKNVRHWAMIAISSAGDEHTLVPPAVLDDSQASVIGAGSVTTKGMVLLPFPLTEPVLSEIRDHSKGVYVFGKVQYDDIFGIGHTSTYRLRYSGIWPPMPTGNFSFCLHGNAFD